MSEHVVVLTLVAYCLLREAYFLYTTHVLLNKLMSRNYHDYQIAQKQGKLMEQEPRPQFDEGIPEDLGTLQGIIG